MLSQLIGGFLACLVLSFLLVAAEAALTRVGLHLSLIHI